MTTFHADYSIVRVDSEKKTVFLIDEDQGNRSVTNDAEYVVKEIHAQFPHHRIYYRDSQGDWGSLLHIDGKFTKFGLPPEEKDYWIC
jgi:hypothetical protein